MPIHLRAPDDFHVHLRQAPLLRPVVQETARWFARVLAMPNTVPPITTPDQILAYRREIRDATPSGRRLEPVMVFKVVPDVPAGAVSLLAAAGAVGGKLYPRGVTTNAQDGVVDVQELYPVLEAMEDLDLVLEVHAEAPGVFSLDREAAYLPTIERIVTRFPALRVVIEHVTSRDTIVALDGLPDTVGATITAHHLLLTLDDVIGGDLHPHHFCKPVAKRASDRDALCEAVLSGRPRVFFGSDSAPHLRGAKESACGCAGVYTAPVAIPLVAELFERAGVALTEAAARPGQSSLEAFVSRAGAEFYGLPLNDRTITLVESEWVVPGSYAGVVPFRAGARLRYDLADGGDE